MDSERWRRVEELFAAAIGRPREERSDFLAGACGTDGALRTDVEGLLAAEEQAGDFIEASLSQGAVALTCSEHETERFLVGPYRVVREVGRGGMSSVYLAQRADDAYDQRVAIKLIRRGMDTDDILDHFRTERRILASLHHPNIARLYDGGTAADGRPYFVMEFIEGLPIDLYCDRHRLGIGRRLELFLEVCSAVHYAHQNLVVHRDLKPSNVLVTDAGVPKLLDFGIAKLLEGDPGAEPTSLARRPMTLSYASPEQILGGPMTTASDVYSLGVLLCVLLSGHRPYRLKPGTPMEERRLEEAICSAAPECPSALASFVEEGVPGPEGRAERLTPESVARARGMRPETLRRQLRGDLDAIVMAALRREPEARYSSVERLAEEIQRHLQGRPLRTRPISLAQRAVKFTGRHRLGVGIGSAFLALILAFGVGAAGLSARTARERDRAEQISSLLVDLFEIADRSPGRGSSITAQELLDQGADKVGRELADQPATQAMLLETLGRLYDRLGLYSRAEALLRSSLEIRRRLSQGADRELAATLNHLGRVLARGGDFESAAVIFKENYEMCLELYGDEHAAVASSLNNLALVTHDLGRYEVAEPLYRRALEMDRRLYGEGGAATAVTISNFALLLYDLGRYEESELRFRQALELRRRHLGEDHPDVAEGRESLALALQALGRLEESEVLQRAALELRLRLMGENHRDVARSRAHLGAVLRDRGRMDVAEPLLRQALSDRLELLGEDHPEVASSLEQLAQLLLLLGELEAAAELLEGALEVYRQAYSGPHPLAGRPLLALGVVREREGRCGEARPLLRRGMALLPARDWQVAEAESALGACLYATDRAQARRLLESGHRRLASRLGESHPSVESARLRLEGLAEAGAAADRGDP